MRYTWRTTLVLAFSTLLIAGCNEDKQKPPEAAGAMPVKVGSAVKKHLTEWDEFTGRFRASERVEVRARVSGYLSEVRFADGQRVHKDDVLFVIDQRPFKIALDRADAAYELARKVYERAKVLRESKAISQQELETREQEFRSAKAALDEARLNMEFTEVKAPVSGRTSRRMVDVGNLVNGNDAGATLLTTVVSEDPIYFYFEASEQDLLKYTRLDKSGERESSRTNHRPLYVKLQDEKDFVHVGKMDFVDNEIDKETGTLEARAEFPNADGTLLPGTFGRARIAGSGDYEATLVPDDIIGTNQTQKFVYVVNADNVLEPHPVTLGPLHENNMRIIRNGLKPEDKIVMGGITMLHPGMKVSPMPMEQAAAAGMPAAPVAAQPAEKPAEAAPEKKPEEAHAPAAAPAATGEEKK